MTTLEEQIQTVVEEIQPLVEVKKKTLLTEDLGKIF